MSQQLTPLGLYQSNLEREGVFSDSDQQQAVEKLQRLYDELLVTRSQKEIIFKRIGLLIKKQRSPIIGIYLWGGVGRGKTWLVDNFYDCLPFKNKQRIHFHRFMRNVHAELKQLCDKTDPLDIIARAWARRVQVLCFDEFVVNDIADAVILARLIRGLFTRGVTIVATSNVEPKNLYQGGLQRDLFLPAIDLIYQYTEVFNLDGGRDYRLEFLDRAATYLFPCNQEAIAGLQYNFARLAPDASAINGKIFVNDRAINTVRVSESVVWLEFKDLCGSPRSSSDYIELAMCYHTILLSAVPQMTCYTDNEARRFINLIDVLYDHNVNILIAADCDVDELYVGTRLVFEFRRTSSRLIEMQSYDYLAQPHIV